MAAIRILIVDDLKVVCQGLKRMFLPPEFEVVGFAPNGKEAIAKVIQTKPDIVLIDVIMPIMDGIKATEEISHRFSQVKVVIISSLTDKSTIAEAISAGAKGYLLKNMPTEDMTLAIRSINSGGCYFAPEVIFTSLISETLTEQTNLSTNGTIEIDHDFNNFNAVDHHSNQSKETEYEHLLTIETISLTSQSEIPKSEIPESKMPEPKMPESKMPKSERTNSQMPKAEKNLKQIVFSAFDRIIFLYGDWINIIFGLFVLSKFDGIGDYIAGAGLFLLVIASVAYSFKRWWDLPPKYRRTINLLALNTILAHVMYSIANSESQLTKLVFASTYQTQIGIIVGIIALIIMIMATFSSFKRSQHKWIATWRRIHWWFFSVLALAIVHVILLPKM